MSSQPKIKLLFWNRRGMFVGIEGLVLVVIPKTPAVSDSVYGRILMNLYQDRFSLKTQVRIESNWLGCCCWRYARFFSPAKVVPSKDLPIFFATILGGKWSNFIRICFSFGLKQLSGDWYMTRHQTCESGWTSTYAIMCHMILFELHNIRIYTGYVLFWFTPSSIYLIWNLYTLTSNFFFLCVWDIYGSIAPGVYGRRASSRNRRKLPPHLLARRCWERGFWCWESGNQRGSKEKEAISWETEREDKESGKIGRRLFV